MKERKRLANDLSNGPWDYLHIGNQLKQGYFLKPYIGKRAASDYSSVKMAFWMLLWPALTANAAIIGLDLDSSQYRISVFEGKAAAAPTETIRDRMERSTCLSLTSDNRTYDLSPRTYADYLKGDMACGYFAFVRNQVGSGEVGIETWTATEDGVGIDLNGHFWRSEELLAMLFDHIGKTLQAKYSSQLLEYAISVPSYWNRAQRRTVLQLASLANMTVVGLIDRPTAAALSYGHNRHSHMATHHALFFNLGRDAVEIAVAKYTNKQSGGSKDQDNIEVLAQASAKGFSSAILDQTLASHFAAEFQKTTNIPVATDKEAMTRLLFRANIIKKSLLTADQAQVTENKLKDGKDFRYAISTNQLKEVLKAQATVILRALDEALSEANVSIKQISDLIMIGNEAKSGILQQLVQDYLGAKLPMHVQDESVMSRGAAIFATNHTAQFTPHYLWLSPFSKYPVSAECVSLEPGKFSDSQEVFPVKTILGTGKDVKLAYGGNLRCRVSFLREGISKPSFEVSITGVEELPWKPEYLKISFEYALSGIVSITAAEAGNSAQKASLTLTVTELDLPNSLTAEQLERTSAHLKLFTSKDERNKAKSNAKNQLLMGLKSFNTALFNKEFTALASESELENGKKAVLEAEDWLKSQEELSAESYVYLEILQKLRDVFREPQERYNESKTRPNVIKTARNQLLALNSTLVTLNNTRSWLSQDEVKSAFQQISELKDWLEQVEKDPLQAGVKIAVSGEQIQAKLRGVTSRVDVLRKNVAPKDGEREQTRPKIKQPEGRRERPPRPKRRDDL